MGLLVRHGGFETSVLGCAVVFDLLDQPIVGVLRGAKLSSYQSALGKFGWMS